MSLNKISAQEYADGRIMEKYRQPLLTIEEAVAKCGWDMVDHPICCGKKITIKAFIGCVNFAECETCGKFIADAMGPAYSSSCVVFADSDQVDIEGANGRTWIAGVDDAKTSSS